VLNALKENQYTGAETQCPNLHLEHFYEACDYTDPPNIFDSTLFFWHFQKREIKVGKELITEFKSTTLRTSHAE
jgi:hypothetical protein